MGKVCDRYCSRCEWGAVVGGFKSCNYLLRTGQRRPCDPGKGCTVRIINKTKRWKKGIEDKTQSDPVLLRKEVGL